MLAYLGWPEAPQQTLHMHTTTRGEAPFWRQPDVGSPFIHQILHLIDCSFALQFSGNVNLGFFKIIIFVFHDRPYSELTQISENAKINQLFNV